MKEFPMSQEVTAYIEKINPAWQQAVGKQLHATVHQALPDVTERLQYGKPHYLKNGKYACVLSTAKDRVSFTIFNAQSLKAPDGFFEPSDITERQTLKIREGQTVDYALLVDLIKQAAATL
jgi:hypothetical protein